MHEVISASLIESCWSLTILCVEEECYFVNIVCLDVVVEVVISQLVKVMLSEESELKLTMPVQLRWDKIQKAAVVLKSHLSMITNFQLRTQNVLVSCYPVSWYAIACVRISEGKWKHVLLVTLKPSARLTKNEQYMLHFVKWWIFSSWDD